MTGCIDLVLDNGGSGHVDDTATEPDKKSADMAENIFDIPGDVRCMAVLSYTVGGMHHTETIRRYRRGFKTSLYACYLSTFDFDRLTRLVAAAHYYCVRVELSQSSPRTIGVILHARDTREGDFSKRHPDLSVFEAHQKRLAADPLTADDVDDFNRHLDRHVKPEAR